MFSKKISKKVTAVAAGIILSVMSSVPALAGYVYEIGYSDDPCPICGETSVWVKEEYVSSSDAEEERDCPDHKYGTDIKIRDYTIVYYYCHECYYGWTEDVYTYFWECHGYDKPNQN